MAKTKRTKHDALPELNFFDTKQSWMHRDGVLSSFVQAYFTEKADVINILEAGCGRKWYLDLGDINYKLTGIDISKEALELRKANIGDLDRAIVGDLLEVKLDREEFDIIYNVYVLEHINGAEQVLKNFFSWLKPKGLLILMFPDRDSVLGFITRIVPHCVHILYYKYIVGFSNAGKPGYGPFPTYYDKILSRRAIHDYCHKHDYNIVLEYGRQYNLKKPCWLALVTKAISKFIQYLSFGKFSADHWGLIYVIEKQ